MNGLEALKEELRKNQAKQSVYVSEEGIVIPRFQYEYQLLIQQAREIQISIKWMEKLNG